MSYKAEIDELFKSKWECEDYYPLIADLRDMPIDLRKAYIDQFVAVIAKDRELIKFN